MKKYFIPIVLGTARESRESEKVALYVFEMLKKYKPKNIETALVDVRDLASSATIPSWVRTPTTQKWADIVERANALIIITPEYNHSFPGELKIVLDYLYHEYENKVVSVCGVSDGQFGGARVVEQLLPVLTAFKMKVCPDHVYFKFIKELFDKKGKITNKDYNNFVNKMFDSTIALLNN